MVIRSIILIFIIVSSTFADVYFIFDKNRDKIQLEIKKDKIEGEILLYKKLRDLTNRVKFNLNITKVDDYFILRSNTLPSNETTAVLFLELKKIFPSIYFIERGSSAKVIKQTKIVTIKEPTSNSVEDDYTIWIALFGLAIIGVLALGLSSFQVQNLVKRHKQIQKKHEEMEQRVNEMFSTMGENIQKLSKDIVKYTSDIIKETPPSPIKNKLKKVVTAESRVLDSASSLLDFLYLKAKKVKVTKEPFNINRVLDDMLENLVKGISRDDVELIFDIDKSMPKCVVGDFRHIGEIFEKILSHTILVSSAKYIKIEFSSNGPYSGGLELQAIITYSSFVDVEDVDKYFIPVYNQENSQYQRLGLYVAQELIKLLGGESFVEFDKKGHLYTVGITLPLEESKDEDRRKYHLPSKEYIQRDILIINQNYEASLALKRLFTYFKHKVRVLTVEKFEKEDINFIDYDILMIDERLIDNSFESKIKPIKNKIKVVGLESIFKPFSPTPYKHIIDIRASRPMTQEKALRVIEDLYIQNKKVISSEVAPRKVSIKRDFKANIPETPNVNLQSFADFSGAKIMVVEDNFINTKMLLKVLEHSNMEIITAENGQKALEEIAKLDRLDLILMDINMPIMDGYIATQKIRQIEKFKDIPIVALSALSLENEFKRMQNSGMDAYIPKPLNIGQLYSVFKMYLKQSKTKETPAPKKMPDKIEGIDLKVALEHVNSNELLLKEVLAEFISLYGDSDKEIQKLYNERRFEQLKGYLFDIIALAGTIGAKDLAHYAQEMRKLYIYDKLSTLPSYLREYQEALNRIKESLKGYL